MSKEFFFQSRALRLTDAATYLAVNINYFNKHIRPKLTEIWYGPQMLAFDVLELNAWFDENKQCNGRSSKTGEALWDAQKPQDCKNVAKSGTSTKERTAKELSALASRIHSKKRKNS